MTSDESEQHRMDVTNRRCVSVVGVHFFLVAAAI